MNVSVLLFAAHRELLGARRVDLDLPEGSTPEDVFQRLAAAQPALAQLRAATTFAVNREIVGSENRLRDGDEVAFLQPVSGG